VDSCVAADGGPGCVHARNTCDDGDSETIDSCDPASGECSHVCDDGDPCTDDVPGPGGLGCSFPQKDCDDADFCTVDSCDASGTCRHEVPPCHCDDGNACTDERCDPKTGIWSNVPVSCDDDNPCTVDSCTAADGCSNVKKNCEDGDPNTYDFCNLVSGECERVLVSCEDHDPCTVDVLDDVAQTCTNLPVDCGDGDACTVDACDPVDGTCSHAEISCADCTDPCKTYTCDPVTGTMRQEPKDCGDGDPCTTDLCAPLTGECDNAPKVCRDQDLCTTDSCDPETGLCRYEPTACSDGKKCNGLETCDPGTGACVAGTAPACDDGIGCTSDSCNAALDDCVNVWKDGARDGPAGDATCSDGVDGDCDGLVDGDDPDCALAITSISPDHLPVGVTDAITITGAGFGSAAAVKSVRFGTFEAAVLSVTPGRILVEMPAMPVGRVDVVVEKAHVSVGKAGGFAVEGRESGISWGNWQWPKSATADEGGRTEKLFGQVYQPGVTPGGNPASIRAQACIGPAGTLPWASAWWTCWEAAFNVVPPDKPNSFEYAVQIDPAPAGRFDAYFRFSVDGGVNWLYADQNGSDDGCTPDQAAKITVWGRPGPGDAILNEIMWMGSNDLSKGPTDKWLELRNFTTKPFRVTGWVLVGAKTGSPPGDVVIGAAGAGHTITSDVLDAGGLLLIARQGAPADTALGSPADIVAPDMALASPNPSYPSRTFQLKANGVVLDTAVVRGDDLVHLGENGANNGTGNDRSMERNDVPGDGSLPANWHTASTSCRPPGAWKGTAPDNGHNFGSPRRPNCEP